MSSWQVQDAKARFSEFLNATIKKGPQVVKRRRVETAVSVPIEDGGMEHIIKGEFVVPGTSTATIRSWIYENSKLLRSR
jgi:prevent-host-death family protein